MDQQDRELLQLIASNLICFDIVFVSACLSYLFFEWVENRNKRRD